MKILFTILILSIVANASLSRSLNYVYDTKNNMAWQDSNINVNLRLSQSDAIQYCEDLKFGGKNNWHLPSRDEYKLIIDKTRNNENMIKKVFKYNLPSDYWTVDTTWRNFGKYGYFVMFKSGTFYYNNKTYKKFVRCVR